MLRGLRDVIVPRIKRWNFWLNPILGFIMINYFLMSFFYEPFTVAEYYSYYRERDDFITGFFLSWVISAAVVLFQMNKRGYLSSSGTTIQALVGCAIPPISFVLLLWLAFSLRQRLDESSSLAASSMMRSTSVVGELERLSQLLAQGLITEEEYNAAKTRVLKE